jgi:hypothetical protein
MSKYRIATILPIILVFASALGFTITVTVKTVDIAAITNTMALFTGKGHVVLGIHEIHAGIRKIPLRIRHKRNKNKYLIIVAPTLNIRFRQDI